MIFDCVLWFIAVTAIICTVFACIGALALIPLTIMALWEEIRDKRRKR